MKIVHTCYPGGFIFIEDQILYDPDDGNPVVGTASQVWYDIDVDLTVAVPKPVGMVSGSESIYLNGVKLREGATNDYLINTIDIDFVNGWNLYINDIVEIEYYTI
jgi:hypothetical protein